MVVTFFEAAKAYLKEAYSLEPGDMDLTPELCQQAEKAGETPTELIEQYAFKHDLTKVGDWTIEKSTKFLNRIYFGQ